MTLHIISLGAGVQSTTLALMAAHGEIAPMPDCAIFADTQDEPSWVYDNAKWLASGNVLPFPVIMATRGKLSADLLSGEDEARIPCHIGAGSISGRQCTRNYKIRVIRRAVRERLGIGPRGYIPANAVEQWIGISKDEADRMKPSGVRFMTNRWPLIEMGLRRWDCEQWLKRHGYPIPWKSACVQCPFLSNAERRLIRDHDPEGHAKAIAIDAALRSPENVKRFHGELYVHPSRRPLSEVDLAEPESLQADLFTNECEGMCGV